MNTGKLCRGAAVLCFVLLCLLLCACQTEPQTPATESDTPTQSEQETLPAAPADGKLQFATDGTPNYRIVYPTQGGNMCLEFANTVADLVESKVGARPRVQKEAASLLVADQPTVYLGITEALAETNRAEDLGYGDYNIFTLDGDIYIAAYSYQALNQGVAYLNRQLRNGIDEIGKNIVLDPLEKEDCADAALNDIPLYRTEKTSWGYEVGGDCFQIVVADAERTDFDAYTDQLKDLSWRLSEESEGDGTAFAVYENGTTALFVHWFSSELHIVAEPKEQAFLPDAQQPAFSKVCDTKGYLVGVYGEGTYENGMSLFYLLADGTFLVYDGGHNAADAANLYAQMRTVANQNNIASVRVSAWIVTHSHSDHVGFFPAFLQQYAATVKIDTLMINTSSTEQGSGVKDGSTLENNVLKTFKDYSPDTRVVRLHSGQTFWLADAHIQVLYTAEDLRQGYLSDYNDASIVTRITVGQTTVLMTGDAASAVWSQLVKRYGAALKSDILQVPHHGANPGGTTEAYDLIDPEVLLWTAGQNLYNSLLATMNPKICAHLVQMVRPQDIHIAGVIGDITEFSLE